MGIVLLMSVQSRYLWDRYLLNETRMNERLLKAHRELGALLPWMVAVMHTHTPGVPGSMTPAGGQLLSLWFPRQPHSGESAELFPLQLGSAAWQLHGGRVCSERSRPPPSAATCLLHRDPLVGSSPKGPVPLRSERL